MSDTVYYVVASGIAFVTAAAVLLETVSIGVLHSHQLRRECQRRGLVIDSIEAERRLLAGSVQIAWDKTCWFNELWLIEVAPLLDEDSATTMVRDRRALLVLRPSRAFKEQLKTTHSHRVVPIGVSVVFH